MGGDKQLTKLAQEIEQYKIKKFNSKKTGVLAQEIKQYKTKKKFKRKTHTGNHKGVIFQKKRIKKEKKMKKNESQKIYDLLTYIKKKTEPFTVLNLKKSLNVNHNTPCTYCLLLTKEQYVTRKKNGKTYIYDVTQKIKNTNIETIYRDCSKRYSDMYNKKTKKENYNESSNKTSEIVEDLIIEDLIIEDPSVEIIKDLKINVNESDRTHIIINCNKNLSEKELPKENVFCIRNNTIILPTSSRPHKMSLDNMKDLVAIVSINEAIKQKIKKLID